MADAGIALQAMLMAYLVFASVTALVAVLVWMIEKILVGKGEKS